ncbi:MAG: glutathione S-transferase N-terminal domain-containing protein [Rhodospirillaceae bacterium]
MKLITAKPSPYVRKVRIALREKGLDAEEIVDVPWNNDTKTPDHNPLGKVPVLILDDGGVVHDSSVICEYLDTVQPEPRMFPENPADRVRVRQAEALANGICDAIVLAVLEGMRPADKQSADWVARQQAKIDAGLKELARITPAANTPGGSWMVGGAMSIADVSAACALRYLTLRLPDQDWHARYPGLAEFSDLMEARPSFRATVPETQQIEPVN